MNKEEYINKLKILNSNNKPKNKVLGKGISALINNNNYNIQEEKIDHNNKYKIEEIYIKDIITGKYQARTIFNDESIKELSSSIKQKGILQPILVNRVEDNKYELIAGERRVRASKLADIELIPAIIVNFNKKEALEVGLIENLQRENLNPIEEATAFEQLIKEFNYTHNDLANILGKSRSYITNYLRILTLPPQVKDLISNKKLSVGHAKIIINYECPLELVEEIVAKDLSVREVENLIKNRKTKKNTSISPNIEDYFHNCVKEKISKIFNDCNIVVKTNNNGSGYIKISFKDKEKLKNFITE